MFAPCAQTPSKPAQPAHVEGLAPVPPQPPLAGPGPQRDRALGALLGLAADDALGTALEFKPRGSFIPLTDIVGGGPFSLAAGEWTDDTAMAPADSLMVRGRLDEADLMARFTTWYRRGDYACTGRCFDIGITTALHSCAGSAAASRAPVRPINK
jgi:ADP-ribosyl-[dinitrogen reductase] hydrolase